LVRFEEAHIYGKKNYFFISLFKHANPVDVELESREVRENRVRKPYGWDSVELGMCKIVQVTEKGRCRDLTIGSRLKYRLRKRETTPRTAAVRNVNFKLKSSGMLKDSLSGGSLDGPEARVSHHVL